MGATTDVQIAEDPRVALSTDKQAKPQVDSTHGSPPVYDEDEIIETMTTAGGSRSSRAWGDYTITYSTGTGRLSPNHPEYSSEHEGYVAMSLAMEAAAEEAFELWDDLIAVSLVERTNDANADIVFNYSSNTGGSTFARTTWMLDNNQPRSDHSLVDADIWMADDWWTHDQDSDLYQGGYGVQTYLHEIGHALGLTHPGDYNGSADFGSDAEYYQDTRQYTVMSYFDADENGSGTDHVGGQGRSFGATPLLHDILTLQSVYGADMTTRTGNTTYGFNANAGRDAFDFSKNLNPVVAIWDAGGIDTLDLSGFGTDQTIDLREGQFSSTGALTNNIAIAFGAVIERAVGGDGSDTMIGNAAANRLSGGGGNDTLSGGAWADTLIGGSGDDLLDGGAGGDRIDGQGGQDWIRFAGANSGVQVSLQDGIGTRGDAAGDVYLNIERIAGSNHGDTLQGDSGANQILGRGGDDLIRGFGGTDYMLGGAGDDTLEGGTQNDVMRGGTGADHLDGGLGSDWAQYLNATSSVIADLRVGGLGGEAAGDSFESIENLGGSAFNDTLNGDNNPNIFAGEGGHDLINGHGGADMIWGNAGFDTLDGGDGDDTLKGGSGADMLRGGGGRDWADYQNASGAVDISLIRNSGLGSDAHGDTFFDIEWLWGGDFDDQIEGSHGNNLLRGGDGDDTIISNGGEDYMRGQGGADTFVFGVNDGLDRIFDFDLAADLIHFEAGTVSSFDELTINNFRGDASVVYDIGDTVLLIGIAPESVTESIFSFV